MRTWIASLTARSLWNAGSVLCRWARAVDPAADPVSDDSYEAHLVDLERPSRGGL